MNKDIVEFNNDYYEKVHKYMLELLFFINNICEKYDIKYTLDCGTLIGAAREKGFIAWDDDADVSFTRDNYDKLLRALKEEKLPDNIRIYLPENESHFFDFNRRIYNTREIVRANDSNKESYGGFYQYAVLDLYVYDNLPDNKLLRYLYIKKLQLLFGLAMSKRYRIRYKKYGFISQIAIFILSKIGKLFSIKWLVCEYEKVASKYKDRNVKQVYCTSWKPEYPGWVYDKKDFENTIKCDFEKEKLSIIENYDKVLTYGYGDYMTPEKTHNHKDVLSIMDNVK